MSDSDIVLDWIEAINRRDRDGFLALSHDEIAFHSPAGVGVGHAVVGDWFDSNRIEMTVRRTEATDGTVIVKHRIVWFGADDAPEYEIENAARIDVRDGKVSSYARIEEPPENQQGAD